MSHPHRPHLIDAADDTVPETRLFVRRGPASKSAVSKSSSACRYVWRVGGNHEFELPLKEGELYEKRHHWLPAHGSGFLRY